MLRSTLKAGIIARSLAIYRASSVAIYRGRKDGGCRKLGKRLEKLLKYSVIPPYLKKRLVPKSPVYRYVGLMPPLQIETHVVGDAPAKGEVRLGIVSRVRGDEALLDVGLKGEVLVKVGDRAVKVGEVVPVTYDGETWRISESRAYTGYAVVYHEERDIASLMDEYRGLRIGTSRLGYPAWEMSEALAERVASSERVAVVFGEPYRGLGEVLAELGTSPEKVFDLYLNFIPYQGTKTVRVEEALLAVLQTLSFIQHAYRSI